MQSLKDMDVLHSGAAEAFADLFQPDTDAPAEYFKIYERKPGLEPEKKLLLAVLEDAIGCFQNLCLCNGQPAEEMVSGSGGMV